MKYFLILVLIIPCFIYGCSSKKKNTNTNIIISEISKKDTVKDDANKFPPADYPLKNGKSFTILQSYESDYLVNAFVIGNGFPESRDTILFDEIELIDTIAVADINNDGYDEIYIFTRGFSPGAYDHVFGVTSDEDKSYKKINFTDIKPSEIEVGGLFDGYQGQDIYTLVNNTIKRTFPVYNAGDLYNNPSRGYKTLYYSIEKTDSGFYFKIKN